MTGNVAYDKVYKKRFFLDRAIRVFLIAAAISAYYLFKSPIVWPLILIPGFFLQPPSDKLRRKYSTLNEDQTAIAAGFAARLAVSPPEPKPEVRVEERAAGLQISSNGNVLYLTEVDLDEEHHRDTRFLIARAITAKSLQDVNFAQAAAVVLGAITIFVVTALAYQSAYFLLLYLPLLLVAGYMFGLGQYKRDAERDILAMSLVGEKELGLTLLEKKYGTRQRWLRPMFWERRIGIVRQYVEGARR